MVKIVAFFRERVGYKSIWHQHLGPVKKDESEKVMPLDDEMIRDLQLWRMETPYADDNDWVFASFRKNGRQPIVA